MKKIKLDKIPNLGCTECRFYTHVDVVCNHPKNVYTEVTPIGNFKRWHEHPLDKNRGFACADFEEKSRWQKFWDAP